MPFEPLAEQADLLTDGRMSGPRSYHIRLDRSRTRAKGSRLVLLGIVASSWGAAEVVGEADGVPTGRSAPPLTTPTCFSLSH